MIFRHLTASVIALLCAAVSFPAWAQDRGKKVDEYLRKAAERKYTGVKPESGAGAIPAGETRWSGPGMVYVEGLIAPDGATAIRLFRFVADSLGADHWKVDALSRMYEGSSGMNGRPGANEIAGKPRDRFAGAPVVPAVYGEKGEGPRDTVIGPDSAGKIVAVYAIQVGAFSVSENAEKLANLLRSKGFEPIIYDNLIDGKRLLRLVWVGRYDTREEALPALKNIEEATGIRGVLREQMIWRRW